MAIDILSLVKIATRTPEQQKEHLLRVQQQIQVVVDAYTDTPWKTPARYVPPPPKQPDHATMMRKKAYNDGIIRGLEMAIDLHGVSVAKGDLQAALTELKQSYEGK